MDSRIESGTQELRKKKNNLSAKYAKRRQKEGNFISWK
jgi:hypothetical protein